MTIQNPDRITTVKTALVNAGLAKSGHLHDGNPFFTSNAVIIGKGVEGVVTIWIMSHSGGNGEKRNKGEVMRIRRAVEEALAGIDGVEIQRKPMSRITAA